MKMSSNAKVLNPGAVQDTVTCDMQILRRKYAYRSSLLGSMSSQIVLLHS